MANKTQYAGQKRKQPTTNVSMAKPKKQYVTLFDVWKYFTKSKDDSEKG